MKQFSVPLQYACFKCRKSFKRPRFAGASSRFMTTQQQKAQRTEAERFEANRKYKCPDCGAQAHFMGHDFKAPKKTNVRAWKKAHAFIMSGKIFYRGTR
jgi:DNA-directed RNA polymerase subunit RPC12/RpoP